MNKNKDGVMSLLLNSDSTTGVAIALTPSGIYLFFRHILEIPIEKWTSFFGMVLFALQVFFLIKDRMKKRRERKAAPK